MQRDSRNSFYSGNGIMGIMGMLFCMVGGTLSFGMTSGCVRDGGQRKVNEKSTKNT